jgi:hypothetical protein
MNTQNQNSLRTQLIYDLGLSELPVEKQEDLLAKMMEVVLKRIFVETMARLNDEDREKYTEMIERDRTPEEVESFVREKIAKYDELVLEIVGQFREEIVEG